MTPSDSTPALAAQLLQQLQGAPMQELAQQLGDSTEQTQNAVAMALPLLLEALGRNSQTPQGAQALFGALQRDHMASASAATPMPAAGLGAALGGLGNLGNLGLGGAGGGGAGLGGLLGSVLGGALSGGMGGGQGAAGGGAGAAILGHILGANRGRVESGLGQASGLGNNAGKLLQMLAPIVMSFLAKQVQSGSMDAGGLGQMLGRERSQSSQRPGSAPGADILTQLLDQNGDGKLDLGDLLKLGGSLLSGRR